VGSNAKDNEKGEARDAFEHELNIEEDNYDYSKRCFFANGKKFSLCVYERSG